jgi:hypothetical protein
MSGVLGAGRWVLGSGCWVRGTWLQALVPRRSFIDLTRPLSNTAYNYLMYENNK